MPTGESIPTGEYRKADPATPIAEQEEPNQNVSVSSSEKNERPQEEQQENELQKMKTQLEVEKRNTAELSRQIKYLQADIINLQRQTERLVSEARVRTKADFVLELATLKEDLQRALSIAASYKNGGKGSGEIIGGLEVIVSRIEGILSSHGVAPVNASLGTKFDPRVHEAVGFLEGEEGSDGKILSVIRSGYTIDGKVIRPALVEVAKARTSAAVSNEDKSVEQSEVSAPPREVKEEMKPSNEPEKLEQQQQETE
jgi:molecular chaperone GrpE